MVQETKDKVYTKRGIAKKTYEIFSKTHNFNCLNGLI